VEFRGFVIGEVAAVDIAFDAATTRFVFPVKLRIYRDLAATVRPRSVATQAGATVRPERRFPLEQLLSARSVERGLRAQMRSSNLLTGQRYVAIDFFPALRNPAGVTSPRGTPLPTSLANGAREIPTAPDAFGELQTSLAALVKRLEALPVEQIAGDLRRTLARAEAALGSVDQAMKKVNAELLPEAKTTIEEARRAMQDLRTLSSQSESLPQDIGAALQDVSKAADALRQLADTLERQPESLLRGKRDGAGGTR
jgi:paraquat-inducible protein B